jgi:hypothetical protein
LTVLWGTIELDRLDLPPFAGRRAVRIRVGKRTVNGTVDGKGSLALERTVKLKAGDILRVKFS